MPVVWGRWLAGVAAMFMLVAIVSGVITHKKIFIDFFTFRWGKGQRSWLDAHNALSVFGLPFHFMITYTGLVTLMALYMPWGEQAAFKTPAERQQLTAELSAFIQPGKPSGQKAPLASVDGHGAAGAGALGPRQHRTASLPFIPAMRRRAWRGARRRRPRLDEPAVSANSKAPPAGCWRSTRHVGAAAETRGVLYALHLGRFSDTVTRWLYFLVSLMGTAMVGTGLVMWTVKRRQKLADPERPHFGFRLVERLNIATIAGLSIAMTAFLWANRLLPTSARGPRRLGDPRLLHRLGPDAAARTVASGEDGLARTIIGGGGAAVAAAGPQRAHHATPAVAQPGRRRLGVRRHRPDVLGAGRAACRAGDTHGAARCGPSACAQAGAAGACHYRLQREGGMNHLPAFALCLAGFTALALATRRQQRDIIGRSLPMTATYALRVAGACALLLALGLLVAGKGWKHRPRDIQRSDQYRGRDRAVRADRTGEDRALIVAPALRR